MKSDGSYSKTMKGWPEFGLTIDQRARNSLHSVSKIIPLTERKVNQQVIFKTIQVPQI